MKLKLVIKQAYNYMYIKSCAHDDKISNFWFIFIFLRSVSVQTDLSLICLRSVLSIEDKFEFRLIYHWSVYIQTNDPQICVSLVSWMCVS